MPDIDDPFLEEVEPTAAQVGVDVPGSRSGFTDFINFGVFNGNFRVGPPNPAANIDPVGAAGSNFVPGWRFVQSSNTVTAKMTRPGAGAGSNLRFTFAANGSGQEAYIEQIVDFGTSMIGDSGSVVRVTAYALQYTSPSYGDLAISTQYLNADGTIAGMPPEKTKTLSFAQSRTGDTAWAFDAPVDPDPAPPYARYQRIRVKAISGTLTFANDWVDIYDIRREPVKTIVRLADRARTTNNSLSDILQSGSNLLWQPSSTSAGTTTTKRLLNYQLVPIPFTVNSIPTSATTDMQPFDNAVNHGTPRISMGWPGWIVGLSYRMTGAPTAGGANALNVWVTEAGVQTWNAFTIASGGSAADQKTQAVGTANMNFTASQGLGVQLVTNGTYGPNGTRNMSVILWVALEYDGA